MLENSNNSIDIHDLTNEGSYYLLRATQRFSIIKSILLLYNIKQWFPVIETKVDSIITTTF